MSNEQLARLVVHPEEKQVVEVRAGPDGTVDITYDPDADDHAGAVEYFNFGVEHWARLVAEQAVEEVAATV